MTILQSQVNKSTRDPSSLCLKGNGQKEFLIPVASNIWMPREAENICPNPTVHIKVLNLSQICSRERATIYLSSETDTLFVTIERYLQVK